MSMNKVLLNARIVGFDPACYKEGNGESKSVLIWCVNVKRDFKKEDEQYYPDDLIDIKAFGPKADFIMKYFKAGDGLIIEGRLQRDDDYEKDGEQKRGQMYVLVENARFLDGSKNSDSSDSSSKSSSAGKKSSSLPKPPKKNGKAPKLPF